jgi:hypothetical protein
MASTNNFAELEMRHAFERDLVRRRGRNAFRKHDIMGLCERCIAVIEKTVSHQKYCEDCRRIVRREQTLEAVRKHRDGKKAQTTSQKKITQEEVVTPDGYTNLMMAILQSAAEEGDQEYLDEFGEVYQVAILGRRLDG